MITENEFVDVLEPDKYEDVFKRAGQIIREGGLVAFPTETVYGLGANALDEKAASKIYSAKGRPSDNPLIVHIAELEDYEKYCVIENRVLFDKLVERFVPGPITIIQKKKPVIPDTVTGGLDSVGIRFPMNEVARRFIKAAGVPIAAPSANTSGKPSPTKAAHVKEDMDGKIDMIIDGGESEVGVESTIVMIDGDVLRLLRPGGITLEMLREIWDKVECDKAIYGKLSDGERPLAPGMKYRHYAPKAPVVALVGDDGDVISLMNEKIRNKKCGIICFEEDLGKLEKSEYVKSIGQRYDSMSQAHRLFDLLRFFDSTDVETIYTRMPDDGDIGLAVVNRLMKACGYTVVRLEK